MKTVCIQVLLLAGSLCTAWAQDPGGSSPTINSIITNRLTNLLEADQILIKGSHDEKDSKLRKDLLKVYPLQPEDRNVAVKESMHLKGVNLYDLGSCAFSTFQPTNFSLTPQFRILGDKAQIYDPDLTSDHYKLFLNSNYVLSLASNNTIEVKQSYFDGKATAALKKSVNIHSDISFCVGNFQNKLANIFTEVRNAKYLSGYYDWEPVYQLWDLLSKEPGSIRGKRVLRRFKAFVVYQNNSANSYSGSSLDAVLNASLQLPFFKVSSNNSVNWSKSESFKADLGLFDIYLLNEQEPETTMVPTFNEILDCWAQNTKNCALAGDVLQNSQLVPGNPFVIQLKFGPLPEENVNNIIPDQDFMNAQLHDLQTGGMKGVFSGEMVLIPKGKDLTVQDQSVYNYELRIPVSNTFISSYAGNRAQLTDNLKIKLKYSNAVKDGADKHFLEKEYNAIPISISTLPMPQMTDPVINFAVDSTDKGNKFYFKSFTIQVTPSQTYPTITGISINDIDFSDIKQKGLFDDVKNANQGWTSSNPGGYSYTSPVFRVEMNNPYIQGTSRIDGIMTININVIGSSGKPQMFKRKFPFQFLLPGHK